MIVEGAVSACLVAGADKAASGMGCGDCMLLCFPARFFAVADGSERFPSAGRELLQNMAQSLCGVPVPESAEEWLDLVNRAYARQPYHKTAAFTGAAFCEIQGRPHAVIVHGGDCPALIADEKTGEVLFSTAADMNFAGRSERATGAVALPLSSGRERVVLASDGLSDVARLAGLALSGLCGAAAGFAVESVPRKLSRFLAKNAGGVRHDDVAVMVIAAQKLSSGPPLSLLLGGTTSYAEADFMAAGLPDRWEEVQPEAMSRELILAGFSHAIPHCQNLHSVA
ncbi:MAG: SpoIIE family protein phosphatase [Thermodesulfobacteriota bacterium]